MAPKQYVIAYIDIIYAYSYIDKLCAVAYGGGGGKLS